MLAHLVFGFGNQNILKVKPDLLRPDNRPGLPDQNVGPSQDGADCEGLKGLQGLLSLGWKRLGLLLRRV